MMQINALLDDGRAAVTTLPHNFKRIRLNLARSKEFPQGSSRHGYEFVAPLDAQGHIDVEAVARASRAIAGCAGSGKARTTRSACWCTRPAAPSMRAGCSTTILTARRRRRERLPLRHARLPAGRICLDPQRRRRDAHLSGGFGHAGDLTFAPPAASLDRRAPGREECAPRRAQRPAKGGAHVLIDLRTYRIMPGRVPAQLELYGKLGYPVQLRYMGEPLCYLVAESGELNTLVHAWVYESAGDREAKRGRDDEGPDWKAFPRRERQGRQRRRAAHQPDDAGAVRAADPDAEDKALAALPSEGPPKQMRGNDGTRTGGEILVDQLVLHGVRHAFCVPGESYLAALDAFHDRDIALTVCRHESGAAMMAEAVGKATGRPGICFVTRGPGATNASRRHPYRAPGFHADDRVRRPGGARHARARGLPGARLPRGVRLDRQMGDRDRRSRAHSGNRLARLPHRLQRPARAGGDRAAGGHAGRARRRCRTRRPSSRWRPGRA